MDRLHGAPSGMALARAKIALEGAGLDPNTTLTRASSVTNEVWLTPAHVVRVNRRPSQRLRREATLGPLLPADVRYPSVQGYGTGAGFDWLVLDRRPGQVLSRCWPTMSLDDRRRAVSALAEMLRALHQTAAPEGLEPIECPQLLRFDVDPDTAAQPLLKRLERLGTLANVDRDLITEARALVLGTAAALRPLPAQTLVHGDLTFENVLWDGETVTALIDFEWAQAAPADLELDVLLRFCAYPYLHVADDYAAQTKGEDYAEVPWWLAEDYPDLFSGPRRLERARLYAIGFDVRAVLELGAPDKPVQQLPAHHPLRRLQRTLHHQSHLDDYAAALPPSRAVAPVASPAGELRRTEPEHPAPARRDGWQQPHSLR